MGSGILSRYNASAGSGKTFKLAGIYLDTIFEQPYNYRRILAVTFTNKAAAEMKERILNTLFDLASGNHSDYLVQLMEKTKKGEEAVRKIAASLLHNILHDYSRFSVGTIDSFFQGVLRSFVRESGLHPGYNLILDHSVILSEAVDEMLRDVENDDSLLKWLINYSHHEIRQGNSWNLKNRILELGEEIFKEEYRLLSEDGKIVNSKDQLNNTFNKLYSLERSFSSKIAGLATDALKILDRYGIDYNDLHSRSNSVKKFLKAAVVGVPDKLSASMQAAWKDNKYKAPKSSSTAIDSALADGLGEVINEIAEYYEKNIGTYKSVRLVTAYLYTLGILSDISEKVKQVLNENNKFLLSDAGDLLRQIIGKNQTPFIYEKIGNKYSNFMIDEFQDTSLIQWENFYPLIQNSIAEGEDGLVVGDIKQAIYRWRNSDWRIFNKLDQAFNPESFRSESLKMNWRSAANIINLNNCIFTRIPAIIEKKLEISEPVISDLYTDVRQDDPGRLKDGYIRLKKIEASEEKHQDDLVLDEIPALIEEIQDNGYKAGDIGILVRKNEEGQKLISHLMNYVSTVDETKKQRYSYQIISQDSLLLVHSALVNFIVSTLRYMSDPDDGLAKASMLYNILSVRDLSSCDSRPDLISGGDSNKLNDNILPQNYNEYLDSIRYLPVFDIIDRLVSYFGLSEIESGIPFLTTLQDLVLDLSGTETNDIPVFLEWWESEGKKKSVSSSRQQDSIQLMTMHKSKGLQFKVVILPFVSWSLGPGMKPIIWVYSEQQPFRELGAVPVRYKKEIGETVFAKYYEREKINAAIDKLNLLYVAMTRAEECLYAYIPVGRRRSDNIGLQMIEAIEQGNGEENDPGNYWNSESNTLSYGTIPQRATEDDSHGEDGVVSIPYDVIIPDKKLRLKLHSIDYIEYCKDESLVKVNYGLLMHDILASIIHSDDLVPALDKAVGEGRITIEEKENLLGRLEKVFKIEKVAEWFSEEAIILNEKDILLPGGIIKRPDRVVILNKRVQIIDFKFAKEAQSHHRQVKEYMDIIKSMGYKMVEGYIWYVDKDKIVKLDE